MDLANLTKYKLIMCDPQKYSNCEGMYKADDGNIVKFEDVNELLKQADNSQRHTCSDCFRDAKTDMRCKECSQYYDNLCNLT